MRIFSGIQYAAILCEDVEFGMLLKTDVLIISSRIYARPVVQAQHIEDCPYIGMILLLFKTELTFVHNCFVIHNNRRANYNSIDM